MSASSEKERLPSENSAWESFGKNQKIPLGTDTNGDAEGTTTPISPLRGTTTHISQTFENYSPDSRTTRIPEHVEERRVLTQPSVGFSNDGLDNEESNLICRVNDTLYSKDTDTTYNVLDLLGTGTFGQVFRCQKVCADSSSEGDIVAVKVIKNKAAYHSQGLVEISLIKVLGKRNNKNLVSMEESFTHRGHICIVFELLSITLLDVLTKNQYRGLPLAQVQSYAKQMVQAFVTLEDANIIHCDLKPENILLASTADGNSDEQGENEEEQKEESGNILNGSLETESCLDEKVIRKGMRALSASEKEKGKNNDTSARAHRVRTASLVDSDAIKIIDFGSACFEGKTMYSYIQSRFYRSPEVLLGVPYNGAIDMWSLACVCVEMYLGLPLFPGVSQHNQLSRICAMLGPPPDLFLEGKNGAKYFAEREIDLESGNINSNVTGPNVSKYRLKTPEEYARATGTEIPVLKRYLRYDQLDEVIMKCPLANKSELSSEQKQEEMLRRASFLDFLLGLFKTNPFERWTAKQASSHPFVTGQSFSRPHVPVVDQKINERKLAFLLAMQRRGYSGSNLMSICKTSTSAKDVTSETNASAPEATSEISVKAINTVESPTRRAAVEYAQRFQPQAPTSSVGSGATGGETASERPRLQRGQPVVPIRDTPTKAAAASVGGAIHSGGEHWRQGSRVVAVPAVATEPVVSQGNHLQGNVYNAYSAVSPQGTWLQQQQVGVSRLMTETGRGSKDQQLPAPPTQHMSTGTGYASSLSSARTPDSHTSTDSSYRQHHLTDFSQAMNRPDVNRERQGAFGTVPQNSDSGYADFSIDPALVLAHAPSQMQAGSYDPRATWGWATYGNSKPALAFNARGKVAPSSPLTGSNKRHSGADGWKEGEGSRTVLGGTDFDCDADSAEEGEEGEKEDAPFVMEDVEESED